MLTNYYPLCKKKTALPLKKLAPKYFVYFSLYLRWQSQPKHVVMNKKYRH